MIIFGLHSLSFLLKKHQFHWQQDHSTSRHEGFFPVKDTLLTAQRSSRRILPCPDDHGKTPFKPSSGAGELCWDSCLGEDTTYHIFPPIVAETECCHGLCSPTKPRKPSKEARLQIRLPLQSLLCFPSSLWCSRQPYLREGGTKYHLYLYNVTKSELFNSIHH